ncbi:MAG: glycosyltransferase [Thermoflexales bacterium]|nr:glycosyltransferase [Thermoflexales bacterium]
MSVIALLLLVVLAVASFGLFNVLANIAFAERARRCTKRPLPNYPFVSVLVPARNEAHTIGRCVRSLLEQDYPNYELIVLNDGSTDATGAILDQLAREHPQLRVIHADQPLPAGVNGKSRACQRLAEAAQGEWLLFTDADTAHRHDSIRRGLAAARGLNVALFSAIPRQELGSWAERLFVPAGFTMIYNVVSFWALRYTRSMHWGNAAAIGQYALVRRDVYFACGGHRAIQTKILDDVSLGELIKRAGYRIAIGDADWVRCRMYRGWGEMVAGFSKNAFAVLKGSFALSAVFVASALLLFYLPLLGLALPGLDPSARAAAGAIVGLTLANFALVAWRLGQPAWLCALYPAQIAIGLGILLNSIRWRVTGRAQWKGRSLAGAS